MNATVESDLIGILLYPSVPKKSHVNILYFHPLQLSSHKLSVATSILFNIQEWGLAHYISWEILG